MGLDLYWVQGSPPCHLVLLVAKALNLELNLKPLVFHARDHLKPEFVKINPQHTVPTLVDGDFAVWESRAISRYLVNKYGPDSGLYPQDPQTRAVIDQRLDFDLGTLYARFYVYVRHLLDNKGKEDEEKRKKVEESLGFLNTFLEGSEYAAGSSLTLADLSLVASVSCAEAANLNLKAYPNVDRWLQLVKSTAPGYKEANEKNLEAFKDYLSKAFER